MSYNKNKPNLILALIKLIGSLIVVISLIAIEYNVLLFLGMDLTWLYLTIVGILLYYLGDILHWD